MNRLSFRAERSGSIMDRLGKPLHGREDRRLSEWEVSESNFWNNSRDVSTSLDTTNPVAAALWMARLAQAIHVSATVRTAKRLQLFR